MQSFLSIFDQLLHVLVDQFYDWKLGLSTTKVVQVSDLNIPTESWPHARQYQATRYLVLKKILSQFPYDYRSWNFVDVGAGKGRVLACAAGLPFKKLIGVEASPHLYQLCQSRLKNYPVSLVESDILDFEIPTDPTVYFLFNPFDGRVLKKFLDKVKEGPCMIYYVNPLRFHLLDLAGFQRVKSWSFFNSNYKTFLYQNKIDGNVIHGINAESVGKPLVNSL